MDAIKYLSILIILFSLKIHGQTTNKHPYSKDTIFVKFSSIEDEKILDWEYQDDKGIYFSIKDKSNKHISLFYPYKQKADTLCIQQLNNYHFSNFKQVRQKEIDWIEKKYQNSKYKPYSGSKNGVFKTYVVEVISKGKFVVYPVIWRNEGSID